MSLEPEERQSPAAAAAWNRHTAAQLAMQAGVGAEQGFKPDSAKHLRVGVNTAMVDVAALCRLLVGKGLVTWDEVAEALAEGMEAEVRRYEAALTAQYGRPVTLRPGAVHIGEAPAKGSA